MPGVNFMLTPYLAAPMKRLVIFALPVLLLAACKSKQQAPLIGSWKVTESRATPVSASGIAPTVGTIYSFRPDSTVVVGGSSTPRRFAVERLPEGLFLTLKDSPQVQYRIVAMTPAELGLQEDRDGAQINLQLEFQK